MQKLHLQKGPSCSLMQRRWKDPLLIIVPAVLGSILRNKHSEVEVNGLHQQMSSFCREEPRGICDADDCSGLECASLSFEIYRSKMEILAFKMVSLEKLLLPAWPNMHYYYYFQKQWQWTFKCQFTPIKKTCKLPLSLWSLVTTEEMELVSMPLLLLA